MGMGTQRSKSLHNFTFPVGLRWGNQRFLRCIKVESGAQFTANDADSSHHHHDLSINQRPTTTDRARDKYSSVSLLMGSAPPPLSDDGFASVRENVKLDVQKASHKLKAATFEDSRQDGAVSVSPVPESAGMPGKGEIKNPWNLRKRRAACSSIFGTDNGGSAAGVGGKSLKPDWATEATDELSGLRSGGNAAAICGEKLPRHKFSIALSKVEIAEDFLAFTGHKPARRPKKRAKIVQRELDTLFPGLSLTEITADKYKVSEGA